MDKRDVVIQKLDTARERLLQVLADIKKDEEIYPHWNMKHFLAHIAGWDEAVSSSLRAFVQGKADVIPAYRGIDDYNAQSVATRQELDLPHIEREWALEREQLKAAIRAIPDEKLAEEFVFPWGDRGTFDLLVSVLIHHEHQHAEEIETMRSRHGEQSGS